MPAVTRVTDVTHFLDHPFTCARAGVQRNGIIGHIGNNGNARLSCGETGGTLFTPAKRSV